MKTRRTILKVAATAAVVSCVALFASACGSGSDTTNPAGGTGTPATGTPITVGFVNSDTGGFAVPEAAKTAQAAADYINANGGINGRPLELDMCSTDATPQASTTCANQFLSSDVPVVLNGYDLGLDYALPIYKNGGLRLFGAFGTPGAALEPENTFLMAPSDSFTAGLGGFFKQVGVRKIVFIIPDAGPQMNQLVEPYIRAAAAQGVTLTAQLVSPANPDVTAAVTAARSADADAILFAFQENDCTNAVRTAKSLGWNGKIFAGACTQFIDELGAQAEGVYTSQNLFPYNARASVTAWDSKLENDFAVYEQAVNAAGQEQYLDSGYGTYGFSTVMTFASILKGISGEITQDSINQALTAFQGSQFLGTQQNCVQKLSPGGACGRALVGLQVDSNGTQKLVGDKPFDLAAYAAK